jgi:AraC-like DNA-binding protein
MVLPKGWTTLSKQPTPKNSSSPQGNPPGPDDPPLTRGLWLASVGHFHNQPLHHTLRTHPTDCLLMWVVRGRGWVRIGPNARRQPALPGELALLAPHVEHEYAADPEDPWDIWWLHAAGPWAESMLRRLVPEPNWRRPLGLDETVRRRFEELVSYALDHTEGLDTVAHCLMIGLVGLIEDRLRRGPEAESPPGSGSRFEAETVRRFVQEHLAKPLSLEDLAEASGLSPWHFSRLFRQRFGLPPMQYLTRQRVGRACVLLRETPMKVAAVARSVGYEDPYHFSRLFKRVVGLSPTAYRKSVRSG